MPSAIFGISGSSENIGGLAPRAFSDIPTALLSTDNPSRFSAFSVYATLVAQASSQPTVNSRPPQPLRPDPPPLEFMKPLQVLPIQTPSDYSMATHQVP
ncbi:hypothetical protein L596_001146 [Steinernema carpocapsae]|uniref:Uncharacterized protein n=1 Tax=Steinernema carpocapsae TaxID=34508 RepID=A0A4U8UKM4_STECR|nr:hypothetical protein L596_001146 [Steinernema carpocapsae]